MVADTRLNGNGRRPFSFSLKPEIVEKFMDICRHDGLIASRQVEMGLLDFIDEKERVIKRVIMKRGAS